MGIDKALEKVRQKIKESAKRADRKPDGITLVAVSKTVTVDRIIRAVNAGVSILGENRVQEAREKITNFKSQIPPSYPPLIKGGIRGGVEWHLIGHLQKNKARVAVQLFDLIHSLDSVELAEIINNYSRQHGKKQRVLLQVKLSDEETKHGINEGSLDIVLDQVATLKHLELQGLMTMPPFSDNPERSRPYFRRLREIRDAAAKRGYHLPELSMGMSNDYEIAIEEGATMIRVGSAIFGERDY